MIDGKTIAVVVPAYNEETQLGLVIESMPAFVDRIVIVNDRSTDGTDPVARKYIREDKTPKVTIKAAPTTIERTRYNEAEVVAREMEERAFERFVPSEVVNDAPATDRIILINMLQNAGVGAAIARGYKWCLDHDIACTAVMAGDGQMDPSELRSIVDPVLEGNADYVKGNRLFHRSAWLVIPKIRYFGNSVLSILTKVASGYWRVSDTQCGYTAISLPALQAIPLQDIYPTYGCPNDILVRLNIAYCTVKEVAIKPVYRVGEKSKMRVLKVIPRISALLVRCFFRRLWVKYLFRDFHPLFLLYHLAFVLGLINVPYAFRVAKALVLGLHLGYEPLLAFMYLSISAFQSLLFAMWMDMQDNERLLK